MYLLCTVPQNIQVHVYTIAYVCTYCNKHYIFIEGSFATIALQHISAMYVYCVVCTSTTYEYKVQNHVRCTFTMDVLVLYYVHVPCTLYMYIAYKSCITIAASVSDAFMRLSAL